MRYAFIKEHRGAWPVGLMAEVLAVSISGYYTWLKRGQSKRAAEDERLTEKIVTFHCGELGPTGRALPVLSQSRRLGVFRKAHGRPDARGIGNGDTAATQPGNADASFG